MENRRLVKHQEDNHYNEVLNKEEVIIENKVFLDKRNLLIDYTIWLSRQKFDKYSSNMVDAFLHTA